MGDSNGFLARPGSGLIEHSLKTALIARVLGSSVGLDEPAFYAGLLHDLGKLNPYYQILFSADPSSREQIRPQLEKEYARLHAIFSALAAYRLVPAKSLTLQAKMQVLFSIAGHHSKLNQFGKSLQICNREKEHFLKSFKGVSINLQRFAKIALEIDEFRELNWDLCLQKFKDESKPELENYSGENHVPPMDYLDFSSVFSALIQADRGSFFEWESPRFNIILDTNALVRHSSPLSSLRRAFQEKVLSENEFQDKLMVLEAPTGIGKTKIFLDIANRISRARKLEHVFYFSPLLALTEDFENKLFNEKGTSVLEQKALDRVLIYNHTFVGSLLKKSEVDNDDAEDEYPAFFKTKEYFEMESFNKELIVTTTQRLLMTLYSNESSDKMKLLSLRNSLLIVDEVQTIPKFLLPNLIGLLKAIAEKYNAIILLVSATIPEQVRSLREPLKYPQNLRDDYLRRTSKRIEFKHNFEPTTEIADLEGNERTLFMANTRRKTRQLYESISKLRKGTIYLSTGIRKRSRKEVIADLHGKGPVTVVSTQVMEAGVDVSFDRMYREMAPLDNIVQAMGRLNREGEARTKPVLSVFLLDGDYRPYSELEMKVSRRLIPELQSSEDLYDRLPEYYRDVAARNETNRMMAMEIDTKMKELEFDEVWSFVKSKVLPVDFGESVLVPDEAEWDDVKKHFLSSQAFESKGKTYRRYADLLAELPRSFKQMSVQDSFDQDLLKKGILLPRKDSISEIYDKKIGLDKWAR